MNSPATRANPSMAGMERKAVKRSSLRKTRNSRSRSEVTSTSTAWANCPTVSPTIFEAIRFHLLACVK